MGTRVGGEVQRPEAGGGGFRTSPPQLWGGDTWAWSIMHLQRVKSVCGRLVRAFSRIWAVTVVWKKAGLNWYLLGEGGQRGLVTWSVPPLPPDHLPCPPGPTHSFSTARLASRS